jgi:hypothetical protein
MERGSDKHSARMDDALEAETRGMMTAGRETRGEEWNSAEPSGEDQPDVDLAPDGTLTGGLPEGLTEQDVEERSQLATYLGKECWPATRLTLLETAAGRNAPEAVLNRLHELPDGPAFRNLQEVWTKLRGGAESRRF